MVAAAQIIGAGAYVNFVTNATGFDELFPGIDVRFLTLSSNMLVGVPHPELELLVVDWPRAAASPWSTVPG